MNAAGVPTKADDPYAGIEGFSVTDNFEGVERIRLPQISIVHQAGMLKLPDGKVVQEVEGYIIDTNRCRVWWEKLETDTPGETRRPDCSSLNGFKPEKDSPKRQADLCADCPQAQMGSAVGDKGEKREGAACKEMRRLHLYCQHISALPIRLSLTRGKGKFSSFREWDDYVVSLAGAKCVFRGIWTKITAVDHAEGQFHWTYVTFKRMSEMCSVADAHAIAAFATEHSRARRGEAIELDEYAGSRPDAPTGELPEQEPPADEGKPPF